MVGEGRPEEVTRARIAFSKPSGKSDVVRSRRSARRRVYVFAPPRRAGKARATHHVDERGRDVRQGLARARIGRPRRGVGERLRIRGACVRSKEVDRASVRILKTSARGKKPTMSRWRGSNSNGTHLARSCPRRHRTPGARASQSPGRCSPSPRRTAGRTRPAPRSRAARGTVRRPPIPPPGPSGPRTDARCASPRASPVRGTSGAVKRTPQRHA